MASRRVEKVAEAIKEEVSLIIQGEVKDPRIGFLTVTAVELSNNLRYAKIFISVYGSQEEKVKALKGLQSATRFIRREIGHRIQLRYTPEIVFKWDESIEKGAHVSSLLRQIGFDK
ncbi:30S ribosome-binding factor RbfA [candidate division NPL-UPA2 bacterium]|nr:30S ribosome-binding factor RbfA [candidate division NPL-UPA2 bacterium]